MMSFHICLKLLRNAPKICWRQRFNSIQRTRKRPTTLGVEARQFCRAIQAPNPNSTESFSFNKSSESMSASSLFKRSNSTAPIILNSKKQKLEVKSMAPTERGDLVQTLNGVKLFVHKLSEFGRIPIRGSEFAAGLDLFSAHDYTIPPYGKCCAMTDIQIALPTGCYGHVAPRSGLSWKHHIDVGAGVIDQDYRGNVGVVLFNHHSDKFTISRGDRIAQLILERIYIPEVVESETALPETERGAGGFGSTGGVSCSTGGVSDGVVSCSQGRVSSGGGDNKGDDTIDIDSINDSEDEMTQPSESASQAPKLKEADSSLNVE